jgi:hypothetical protein
MGTKVINKTRKSYFTELSLEDLQYGIHHNKSSVGSVRGIESLLSPLTEKTWVDPAFYSAEAFNSYGEACQFGLFATQGLENLNTELALLGRIKSVYHIKGLEGIGLKDVKETLKKVGAAIVAAFKKLIQAAANLFRSIANTIGSIAFKGQEKLFQDFKDNNADYRNGKGEVSVYPTYNGIELAVKLTNNFAVDTNSLYNDLVAKVQKAAKDPNVAKDIDSVKKKIEEKIIVSKFKNIFDNPRKAVFELIFGKEKPEVKKMAAGNVIKIYKPTELLTSDFSNRLKEIVKDGKELIKKMNDGLKAANEAAKEAIKESGMSKTAKKNANESRKAINGANWARNYCGKMLGMYLNIYSAGIKARSFSAAALRVMKKEPKD